MLVFALALTLAGLIALSGLIRFVLANLVPLLAAIGLGNLAFHTGGGWAGAGIVTALAYAGLSAILQIVLALMPLAIGRLVISVILVAPAAMTGFALTHTVLTSFNLSPLWRFALATLAAFAIATDGVRQWLSLR